VPEVDPKNVGIQIENGTLTLKGARKFEEQKNGKGARLHPYRRPPGTAEQPDEVRYEGNS
jgi:HSP20 family molecular chaperone IbpA